VVPGTSRHGAVVTPVYAAWYFEKGFGGVVLDRTFGEALAAKAKDFGIDLVPTGVESRIAECRVSLATMRERFPRWRTKPSRLARSPFGENGSSLGN
jgi:hypothetical protein